MLAKFSQHGIGNFAEHCRLVKLSLHEFAFSSFVSRQPRMHRLATGMGADSFRAKTELPSGLDDRSVVSIRIITVARKHTQHEIESSNAAAASADESTMDFWTVRSTRNKSPMSKRTNANGSATADTVFRRKFQTDPMSKVQEGDREPPPRSSSPQWLVPFFQSQTN